MAGKSSEAKVAEENRTEAMESEVLSKSDEMSDNTESTNESSALHEKKPETSQMQNDDTSGIEIVSTPTSASEIPHKNSTASKIEEPSMQTELSETEMITSASEISCEGIANSDGEEKAEPSTQTDPIDELSRSLTSAAEIGKSYEEKEALVIESQTVSKTKISDSESPCQQETSDAVKSEEAAATETSPQPIKGKMEKLWEMISPKKPKKPKKSRSKSMSPSEKPKSNIIEDTNASSEDRILSEGEEHVKSDSEKSSMSTLTKNLKRQFSKFKIMLSGPESKSIVPREATEQPEEPDVSKSKTEVETKYLEQSTLNTPRWTKTRTSLAEVSLGGTTMTDVPSSSSSSVFSATSSKPSAVEENTSEEAVASSLVNSPDDQISSIKEDKNAVNESEEKDGSSSGQKIETAAPDNADQEQSSSEENPKSPENNDEIKSSEN